MARVGVGLSSLAVSICLFGGTADCQVRGRLAFESFQATARGLDYNNPMEKPVRRARVLLVDAASETILAETVTGNDGSFSFSQSGSGAKLVVLAQTLDPAIRVEDNTDNNLTWAAESPPLQGSENINLLIPSGWNGSAYSEARVSGPFAILDAVYGSAQAFRNARPVTFPPLRVNWSADNRPEAGNVADGQIGTSHWDGTELFILGKADVDTDEFDVHVVVHEWGHYFQNLLSRSDSIGGDHAVGDALDARVAFDEGWANALSAIVLHPRTTYLDTNGAGQRGIALSVNLEDNSLDRNPGWFSEIAVGSIVFDIFDGNADGPDSVALGLGPIYDVMAGPMRATSALTTIFAFISGLKDRFPGSAGDLDRLTSRHAMIPIRDPFGIGETNNGGSPANLPVYREGRINGNTVRLRLLGNQGLNKIGQNRYVAFRGDGSRVTVTATTAEDVLLRVYDQGRILGESDKFFSGVEDVSITTIPDRLYIINVMGFETEGDYDCTVDILRQ